MESLVSDMRAYCLVETDMEELQTIAWYQVTTSISDTAAVLSSPQGSRQSDIARSNYQLILSPLRNCPNSPIHQVET